MRHTYNSKCDFIVKQFVVAFFSLVTAGQALALISQTINFPVIGVQSTSNPIFILGAAASSGLQITYAIVGNNSVANVLGSTVRLSGSTGAVTVKASQVGNGTYAPAADVYQTFTVVKGTAAMNAWKSIATGSGCILAVKGDGTLWAWGYNGEGSLGDGTTEDKAVPEQIGTATNWAAVAANDQSVALKTDGTLWTWGHNYYGELGNGTETNETRPQQIGTATWKAIAAGYGYTVAIKSDGTLWQAGNYIDGFTQIDTAKSWVSVTASYSHALAVKSDGTLWGWGDNSFGESGGGNFAGPPVQIGTATDWRSASAGQYFSAAVKKNGTLWTWGINLQDTLGNGSGYSPKNPVQVGTDSNWQFVAAGVVDSLAVKTDGSLWAWGDNQVGEVGDGTFTPRNVPVRVGQATNWQLANAGSLLSVAVKADGSLWTWGFNANGQLGYGNRGLTPVSPSLGSLSGFAQGSDHAVAIKEDGTLWAWGDNQYGQLGDGTTLQQKKPEQIGLANDWKLIFAGAGSTFAIKTDGTLWAWGDNRSGQLGDGTTIEKTSPMQVGTAANWKAVTVGFTGTLAVKTDGTLWAWGINIGELGLGTPSASQKPLQPTQVGTDANWKSVLTNGASSFALKTDGTLWAWGYNGTGSLGDGSVGVGPSLIQSAPEQLGTATNWQSITLGGGSTFALKTDGTLWAWGNNQSGQLGDGTTTSRNSPEQVGLASNWTTVVAGLAHVLAVKADGTLWTWGNNEYGQLGDGTTTQQDIPEQIGISAKWFLPSNGGMVTADFSLVTTADGTLWGWGDNSRTQLAGAGIDSTVPERALPGFTPQTLSFPSVSAILNKPVTLNATATSGLPITYRVSGPATLSGNQLTVTGPGTVNLIAYQDGDTNWGSTGPTSATVSLRNDPCKRSPSQSWRPYFWHHP